MLTSIAGLLFGWLPPGYQMASLVFTLALLGILAGELLSHVLGLLGRLVECAILGGIALLVWTMIR